MIAPLSFVFLALAQVSSPVVERPTSVLASGEIPLEVAAKGTSINVADKATIVLNLRCSAETSVEAKKLVRERADSLSRDLAGIGVPTQNIAIDDPATRLGFVGNEAIESVMNAGEQGTAKPKRWSSLAVTVTFTDLSLLGRVQNFLDQKDAITLESPLFELSDARAARRAAIADALQNARTDAEAYAASLGMRVSRLTGVRDQDAQASPFGDSAEIFQKMMQQKTAPRGKVETDVRVTVEFALAPR
jgi:uncharacterized protein YggE